MKDGEGRDIDFKNTVIIMTSNAGTDLITKLFADPETAPDAAGLAEALRPELAKYFKPAFLGRVTLVPYFPLSDAIIRQIVVMQLERIRARVRDSYRATFDWDAGTGRHDRGALHGKQLRRAQRREHPDAHAAARVVRRRCLRDWPTASRSEVSKPASTPMGCFSLPSTNRKGVDSSPIALSNGGRQCQSIWSSAVSRAT